MEEFGTAALVAGYSENQTFNKDLTNGSVTDVTQGRKINAGVAKYESITGMSGYDQNKFSDGSINSQAPPQENGQNNQFIGLDISFEVMAIIGVDAAFKVGY